MPDHPERIVARTQEARWQVGARRTLPVVDEAWRQVSSPDGVALWLGSPEVCLQEGAAYELPDGTTGEVRVYVAGSRLRRTWHPHGWSRASTIQVLARVAARLGTLPAEPQ